MGVVTLVDAIFAKVAADEVRAWIPGLSKWALNRAVTLLPVRDQPRYREEWSADLAGIRGEVSKLAYSLGFIIGSARIALAVEQTTISGAVWLWLLWRIGFIDLTLVNWKIKGKDSAGREHGTLDFALRRLSVREWPLHIGNRGTIRKIIRKIMGVLSPAGKLRALRTREVSVSATIQIEK
jgi:hypothetical protein